MTDPQLEGTRDVEGMYVGDLEDGRHLFRLTNGRLVAFNPNDIIEIEELDKPKWDESLN